MTREQILKAIEEYAVSAGLAPSTVTERAVGNSRLYKRIKAGGDCTTEVAGRLLSFIADHPPAKKRGAA